MPDHNSGDINAKELAEIHREWTAHYLKILDDVKDAIVRLEEVKNTLETAKKIYEKSWSCVIKENFKTFCISAVVIIAIIVSGTICLLRNKNTMVNVDGQKVQVEVKNK